jgi:hypothetical protein
MCVVVRRFLESLAWILIGLMFLYTVLQSLGLVTRDPPGGAVPQELEFTESRV